MTITNYRAMYRDKNGSLLFIGAYSGQEQQSLEVDEIDVLRYFYHSLHEHNTKNNAVRCCEIVYDIISDNGEYWDTFSFANLYL